MVSVINVCGAMVLGLSIGAAGVIASLGLCVASCVCMAAVMSVGVVFAFVCSILEG